MQTTAKKATGSSVFSLLLYILAAIVLVVGLWQGISFLNAPNIIHQILPLPFQSPILDMFLVPILRQIGILILAICLLLSGALFELGLLFQRNAYLSARVAALEVELGQINKGEEPL